MPGHDIVAVGASAGGVEALGALVRELPGDLPAALFVVMHFSAESRSVLPRILSAGGRLPATHASDREVIVPGRIYVARPDHHLTLRSGHVRVVRGPRENGHRPAIDALFRTAAHDFGARVIGVVLSGALDDGTAGLLAIKRRGGTAVVQDPEDALVQQMPRSALEHVDVDHVLSAAEIGKLLPSLVRQPADLAAAHPDPLLEMEATLSESGAPDQAIRVGRPSALACPECGGVLNEIEDGGLVRYRCQVGHAFAPESLHGAQRTALEGALWAALRALEEQAALARRMAVRAREMRQIKSSTRHDERAEGAEKQARIVRQVLGLGSSARDLD